MTQTIFIIIIIVLVFEYLTSRILKYLNNTWRGKELPKELKGIYDEEKYKKSQEYGKINSRFDLVMSTFHLILILLILFMGGFAYFDEMAHNFSKHPVGPHVNMCVSEF